MKVRAICLPMKCRAVQRDLLSLSLSLSLVQRCNHLSVLNSREICAHPQSMNAAVTGEGASLNDRSIAFNRLKRSRMIVRTLDLRNQE